MVDLQNLELHISRPRRKTPGILPVEQFCTFFKSISSVQILSLSVAPLATQPVTFCSLFQISCSSCKEEGEEKGEPNSTGLRSFFIQSLQFKVPRKSDADLSRREEIESRRTLSRHSKIFFSSAMIKLQLAFTHPKNKFLQILFRSSLRETCKKFLSFECRREVISQSINASHKCCTTSLPFTSSNFEIVLSDFYEILKAISLAHFLSPWKSMFRLSPERASVYAITCVLHVRLSLCSQLSSHSHSSSYLI